jgi:hypothetical protein
MGAAVDAALRWRSSVVAASVQDRECNGGTCIYILPSGVGGVNIIASRETLPNMTGAGAGAGVVGTVTGVMTETGTEAETAAGVSVTAGTTGAGAETRGGSGTGDTGCLILICLRQADLALKTLPQLSQVRSSRGQSCVSRMWRLGCRNDLPHTRHGALPITILLLRRRHPTESKSQQASPAHAPIWGDPSCIVVISECN